MVTEKIFMLTILPPIKQIKMRDEQPRGHDKTVALLNTALENYPSPLGAAPEAPFHALWQPQVLAPSIRTCLGIAFFLRLLLVSIRNQIRAART